MSFSDAAAMIVEEGTVYWYNATSKLVCELVHLNPFADHISIFARTYFALTL